MAPGRCGLNDSGWNWRFYDYDAVDRLTHWTYCAASTPYAEGSYEYSAAGNVRSATVGGVHTDFAYDGGNRLTGSSSDGGTTYTNDADGRRTGRTSAAGTTTYDWSALGQLTSVASSLATVTYEYGASGMRELKRVVSAEGTTSTQQLWSGGKLIAEKDSDGTTFEYAYGPGGVPLTMRMSSLSYGTHTFAYIVDHEGSVLGMVDESGYRVATYRYDPWGRQMLAYGGVFPYGDTTPLARRQPLRYRGYYYDAETAFYYLPARYYDPATYRFLSPDPAPPSAGNPLSLNAYSYCENDPVNASDPTGEVMTEEAEAWSKSLREYDGDREAAAVATKRVRWNMLARRYRENGHARRMARWLDQVRVVKKRVNLGFNKGFASPAVVFDIVRFEDPTMEAVRSAPVYDRVNVFADVRRDMEIGELPCDHPVRSHVAVGVGPGQGGHMFIADGWLEPGLRVTPPSVAVVAGIGGSVSREGAEGGFGAELSFSFLGLRD